MMCEHKNFFSVVRITRLDDGDGKQVTFRADIEIKCSDCNSSFEFIGLDYGYNFKSPTKSIKGTELRVPIMPLSNNSNI